MRRLESDTSGSRVTSVAFGEGTLEESFPSECRTSEETDKGIIRHALDSLPAAVQTVIQLCYFNGLSHCEMAENLGEPLGTVKSRIRQELQIMRTKGLAV